MKKQIVLITMLSVLAASAGCASESGITTYQSQGGYAQTTVPAAQANNNTATTAAQAAAAQSNGDANAASEVRKDEGQVTPCINPEFYLFGGYINTQSDALNMRREPNTNSEILEQIPSKTQIDVYSSGTEGWYLTIYNNKTGYISADYVAKVQDYAESSQTEQPNAYGFYPLTDPPASSVSVASLSGTWVNADDTAQTLVITSGGQDLYSGYYTFYDGIGNSESGCVLIEYTLNPDNTREYRYTFYSDAGIFWNGFAVSGEVPLNDIYAGQQGSPHFTRQ